MGKKKLTNTFLRSFWLMGSLSSRRSLSSSVGGGTRSSIIEKPTKGTKNKAPVTAGIQNSVTLKYVITRRPADFTTPLDTIKLELRMTPRISVNFLPSTYEKTTPHIIPNESPFKNIKNIL